MVHLKMGSQWNRRLQVSSDQQKKTVLVEIIQGMKSTRFHGDCSKPVIMRILVTLPETNIAPKNGGFQ